ncbi:MAG: acetate--CoA ligase [Stygiobacter sp. RIFOXYC12_FULL_38_8]|nr:MAG: acetate--CoA ligase [Stygiobacter sp. RIFOXYA12_FULL_38_9]OGV06929.1 MAG: acetate--CoA ligase [Stygiobacter sp. RIFOXYB2_FULL_37_11]OGV11469.1 MAG: acetate--CoA ligase [Stygiobacter sp. RIFOXYA2_FULL_38_8]OGV14076.1 MAG: acetate--CoA ligase [Stygiobacter sp. RIFOXYC2_FULL_38_25]OGV25927.1 MAG: acetate--CoA ligase [Stygiobacter sp. RIFOXYC12_FULL_38_8]OGV82580.1 MAG: acetate--CoA ligase [Stygiobacter sp. GWF2_38_21]RJQ63088.1 MAG: acetate--CoA ligase [Stygiobacter sp.]
MSNAKLSGEVYYPSKEIIEKAHIKDWDALNEYATNNNEAFWEERANELHWFEKWNKVLDDSEKPFYKWFVGGKTNIAYNCLDIHIKTSRRNKLALIWEGENGEGKTMSYFALHREACKFGNVLKSLGVKKGDRVTIYMGRIPEIVIAMLACARVGAIHSVVYGGFSVESLAERIEDSNSRVLIVSDGAYQRGKVVPLKQIADEALQRCGTVEHCVVVKRTGAEVNMEFGRDMWYHELMNLPQASRECSMEKMDAEDPLFILYTSGTTGKPKAILHTHGGYMVGTYTSLKYVFDIQEEDRYWCAADPGWITGHSYIVYGPLLNGTTSFMYEGAPNFPYPNRWWAMIEKYGINILYTAPTAIRGLMRFGESWVNRHDLSTLRLLGSVGEPINPEAWKWYHRVVGKEKCPIMDTWWQTETGMFMITPLPCVPLKPGSGTKPFPGIVMDVVDENGKSVKANEEGYLVIKTPWPAMIRTVWKDDERYVQQYWSKYPGVYLTGDSVRRDEDGYYWIIGRVDDVIKVSGYRLGTAEIESALVSHSAVAEAAAIGLPHEVKGNAIYAYVILKAGAVKTSTLTEELRQHVSHEVGPIAKPEHIEIVDSLPKTRSGKIMRRVLKARALGQDPGNISTLEE